MRGHPRRLIIGSERDRRRIETTDLVAALTPFDLRAHLLPVHRSLLSPRHCNTMIGFMFRLDVTSAERPHRPEGVHHVPERIGTRPSHWPAAPALRGPASCRLPDARPACPPSSAT